MSVYLSPLFALLAAMYIAHADDGSARYHCEGKTQETKLSVEFDFVEDGYIEGVGFGSEVISVTRVGKRAVVPAYRFQRVGATEENACEPDSFGDHYLWKFTQIPNHSGDGDRYPYRIGFQVECADMPLLNVSAKCERN